MLDAVRERARPYFDGAAPAHDWSHVERVDRLARRLAPPETDERALRSAVYLHDVGREKEAAGEIDDHAAWGADRAREILTDLGAADETVEAVAHCVLAHRFSNDVEPQTVEARVLSDADNIDALGAVGVARCFAHGGTHGYPLHGGFDRPASAGELAHVHEKLLALRDRMYTEPGRRLAEERHTFVESFANRFAAEVRGEQ